VDLPNAHNVFNELATRGVPADRLDEGNDAVTL
jgi:hypothetical protein